ncbi:uncharacterized protein MELLADRAFT_59956 [Melampsora larici-populina 98AG31]|uniref:Uncharacterized protein n=1 Tax=Melampsora larici-populina (strain 98AG31 / pathotype 3-4-7) TaxID=747676 RepID=F4R9F2_MELLP|nr:uncharacterized protein MELLADRAFT_59956 [Melampsora larici-populina 98AG31]EGG11164.1 hypothetical protein MELLADRAFT_59956 [Melampsora larici-populina 98AG31]
MAEHMFFTRPCAYSKLESVNLMKRVIDGIICTRPSITLIQNLGLKTYLLVSMLVILVLPQFPPPHTCEQKHKLMFDNPLRVLPNKISITLLLSCLLTVNEDSLLKWVKSFLRFMISNDREHVITNHVRSNQIVTDESY